MLVFTGYIVIAGYLRLLLGFFGLLVLLLAHLAAPARRDIRSLARKTINLPAVIRNLIVDIVDIGASQRPAPDRIRGTCGHGLLCIGPDFEHLVCGR